MSFPAASFALLMLGSGVSLAQWNGATSDAINDAAHDYNATANWTGATVNDTFVNDTVFTDTTLYFSADRTTVGDANGTAGLGLYLGYGGGGILTLQGGSTNGVAAADHTLTLGGDIFLANAGNQTTVIGNVTPDNALNVDLGGVTRTIGGSDASKSVRLLNTVSNGALVIDNGVRVELGGTNTFAGGITVRNGTLNSFGENATAAFGSGTITLGDSSGSANATLGHASGSNSIANNIVVAAGSTGTLSIAPGSGNDTYSGTITLANNLTLAPSSNGALNLTGGITGTGNITVDQQVASYTTISGGAMDFTGTFTNASAGTGDVQISSAIGANVQGLVQNSATSTLVVNGDYSAFVGSVTVTTGTLRVGSASTFSGAFLGTGTVAFANGGETNLTGDLSGFTGTYDVQTTDGGKLSIKNTNTAAGSAINIATGATLFAENATIASDISVAGTGNNEFRGALRINDGTNVTGAVTLTGSATVGGGGTISGVVSGDGFSLSTSTTDGRVTLTGANTFTGGAIVTAGGTMQTGATGTFGAGDVAVEAGATLTIGNFDSINNTGMLSVLEASFVNLNFTGEEIVGAIYNATDDAFVPMGTYTALDLNNLYFGGNPVFNGAGMLTVVPEPSTYGLLMLGLLAAAGVVVRRRKVA